MEESITLIDTLKIFATPVATIGAAFFVYLYTKNNHKRTLLSELDSKSEWRKTLFMIAGKNRLKLSDIEQIRATVRAFKKDYPKSKFDQMTTHIIDFCDSTYLLYYTKNEKELPFIINQKAKIYCRYLLAYHWEILQLSTHQLKRYNKIKNEKEPLEYRTFFNFKYFQFIEKEEELYYKTIKEIEKYDSQ
ncbi:hypothetical protein FH103_02665 [Staphylococcus hominis]|uniref:hypothetical protein n=1 Tax=Staphylococcus hominis TaxID=1290 RepID=UPI001F5713EF|nr:hypothetical protein [Staphylococcus hominis]MCI2881548.1 hypothetical protein [Staphylococcus hominis]